jgi:hypothetical protein
MQGYCGKCGLTFDGQMLCPRCGTQLSEDGPNIATIPLPVTCPDDSDAGPSFLRRVLFGAIALGGVFQGLKHIIAAVAVAGSGGDSLTSSGILGLLVAATLAAAVVSGMLNRRAEFTGLILGVGAAGVLIGMDLAQGIEPPDDWLIGVPALLGVVGMIGGLGGRLMIPPAPKLPKFGLSGNRIEPKIQVPAVRIVWWRILGGAVLTTLGVVYADEVRFAVSRVVLGHGGTFGASRLVTWQISVLATVMGGVLAGATTRGGLRHGLIAGLFAATATVIAFAARDPNDLLVLEFWMDNLNLGWNGPPALAVLGASIVTGAGIGGWMGYHLFPPQPTRRF